jgi:hypothetical protein
MLEAGSPVWAELRGGYRVPYDPRPAIRRLEGDPAAWEELWNELHHQGDVGDSSYVAVPLLVQLQQRRPDPGWQFFALIATIETERHRKGNPPIPEWLTEDYAKAWREVPDLAMAAVRMSLDPLVVRSALAVLALAKGELKLGALLASLDTSEIDELVNDRLEWTALYE